MLAESPGQLAAADIDGEYFFRAVLEEAVSEPAGGGAEVNGHALFHVQLKLMKSVFEFVAAAADVFFPGFEFDAVVGLDDVARFARGLAVDSYEAGHDGAFGFFTGFAQAAFDESLIEAGHTEGGKGSAAGGIRAVQHQSARGVHSAFRAPHWAFIQTLP